MPFAKRGDVVHSEATSGFNNQKKSLLINGLAALGDSLYPLHFCFSLVFPHHPPRFHISDQPSQSGAFSDSTRSLALRRLSFQSGIFCIAVCIVELDRTTLYKRHETY